MVADGACPECGAKNAPDARRCRICGRLINAAIPEVDPRDWELPEHVRRQMERELGLESKPPPPEQTHVPGGAPIGAPDLSHLPPPPGGAPAPAPAADTGFGSLPPPPAGAAPVAAVPPPAPAAVHPPPPVEPPPAIVEPPWDPSLDDDEVDGIVIEARPRHEAIPVFAPEEVVDEVFDPDALFRDLGQAAPPPPPPRDPDEIVLPPREIGPDPLWAIAEGRGDLSNEEIDRLMKEALREERLKRRPGFLDKVIKTGGEDDAPPLPPPPLPPPPRP